MHDFWSTIFSRASWHYTVTIRHWYHLGPCKPDFLNVKLIVNQSESRFKDLRLIFLICIQTQIWCNGAIETSDKPFTWYLEPSYVSLQENAANVHSDAVCRCFFGALCCSILLFPCSVCVCVGSRNIPAIVDRHRGFHYMQTWHTLCQPWHVPGSYY